jgi:VWFA-related protein
MTGLRYLPLFAAFGCLGAAWADEPVVFRSDVALVRVEAQVVDRANRTITGLGPRDFVLRESGKFQNIQGVDSENLPIDLVLLLDVSASMRPHIQRVSAASHDALRQMRDDDRIAIMVFDRATRVRMGFRNGREAERGLERVLDEETFRGGTDITVGMYDAADFLRREGRPEARKAIVIVTDDETERNRDVDGVSRALSRADAVLSALIAPDAMRGRVMGGGGRYPGGGYPGGGYPGGGGGGSLGGIILGRPRGGYPGGGGGQMGSHTQSAGTREIALRSGGDSLTVDDGYALQDTLARIRQRYALHFYLPDGVRPGEERYINVELADNTRSRYPGAEVRYRQSYFAPIGAGGGAPGNSPAPIVVSRTESSQPGGSATSSDPDRPAMRRRPAVSQPDSPGGGPLIRDGGGAVSQTPPPAAPPPAAAGKDQPAWRKADPGTPTAPGPNNSSDPTGGWRKARPEDLPQQ